MFMRQLRTYLNEPFTKEDGPPLKVRLFRWMLPKSKWYEGTVLSWDGSGMAYVQLARFKKVVAGCGKAHPDMPIDECDRDPECEHWALDGSYAIGDQVKVLYVPPCSLSSEAYIIPDTRPLPEPTITDRQMEPARCHMP